MKTARKALMLILCAALLVSATVMGTLAYLTSQTDTVTNTFTVGNVAITLDEAKVDVYGVKDGNTRVTENNYKLIPGHTYVKDPTVHVTAGSEKCWLFVKVVDEIAAIQDTTTVAAQMTANKWTAVAGAEGVYAYESIVDAGTAAQDVKVFDNFKIKGNADVADYTGKTITIQAYAIQADGFGTAAAAWKAAPLSAWTTTPNPDPAA